MTFSDSADRFNCYVDTFRSANGSLVDGMQCKLDHTWDVVRFAGRIAEGENFREEERELALLCALFHDIARFEQVRKFSTFNDALSNFDHGYEGVRILYAQDLLKGLPPAWKITIAAAVEFHNKLAIPEGILDDFALKFARLTRDADKLAILELVLRYFAGELKLKDDSLISLSRKGGTDVAPEIIESVLAGKPTSYRMIRNENDFKTCLFGWASEMEFSTSRRLLKEKNFYPKLRSYLPEDPVFDTIVQLTEERLSCRCSK